MATYQYRCTADGMVDVTRPIGTATPNSLCAVCGRDMKRVFSVPMLALGSRPVVAAIDHAERSRDVPEVVDALPAADARRRSRMAPPDPALQRLPRP